MSATVISLTSIPPRLHKLGQSLECLRNQTACIDAIILWLPKRYRRPEFRDSTVPSLPSFVDVRYCDEDFGPATKILPAVQEFSGQDVRIIYCDDDELYSREWAETLVTAGDRHPHACVTVAGLRLESIDYEYFIRSRRCMAYNVLTLGLFRRYHQRTRRPARPRTGPVDICQGFGGVLVRPHFFGPEVFDIPDVLWLVDDVWLSGHLAFRGVPIHRIAERKLCHKSELAAVSDLTSYTFQGHDRITADWLCVQHYRTHYGIWKGKRRPVNQRRGGVAEAA